MILDFLKSSYKKVRSALAKTTAALGGKIAALFGRGIDEETFERLEELLYEADLGVNLASEIAEKFRVDLAGKRDLAPQELVEMLTADVLKMVKKGGEGTGELSWAQSGPTVALIVGVNGNGKTTTVAKLAKLYKDAGKRVLVAAADTFRAAAVEQLELWAGKTGVEIVKAKQGSDPAAVVYDALQAAIAREVDLILIDTAGRLQSKKPLMQELGKIGNVCKKLLPDAPHEVLMVLDSTTGQNAIDQARTFNQYTPLTGIVLTKLDGTAKGGIALAIQRELDLPVKFIGLGEGMGDLEKFDAEMYVKALFGG